MGAIMDWVVSCCRCKSLDRNVARNCCFGSKSALIVDVDNRIVEDAIQGLDVFPFFRRIPGVFQGEYFRVRSSLVAALRMREG
jgi:hypothetical protein